MKYMIGNEEHLLVIPSDLPAIPLGTILSYTANSQTPPPGFLYAEGQAVSRTMYADYFALVGTLYGAGDGSTTFNLPNMIGKFPEGASSAGVAKAAGLPNITGQIDIGIASTDGDTKSIAVTSSGAFNAYDSRNLWQFAKSSVSSSASTTRSQFDASRSSSVYKNDVTTVQPPSLTVRWIVKVYDCPVPSADINLSVYASDLASRLQREQVPAYNNAESFTSSGTYTAPYTGWYEITVKAGGGGGAAAANSATHGLGGGGGGEGGMSVLTRYLNAGEQVPFVIGSGGAGGTDAGFGSDGGNSSFTYRGTTYTVTGGKGGGVVGGQGGSGTTRGEAGGQRTTSYLHHGIGGSGGGQGGGVTSCVAVPVKATSGSGGAGGSASWTGYSSPFCFNGGAGGDGYIWFKYFDPNR